MNIKDVKYVYLRDDEGKIITSPKKTIVQLHAIVNGKPRWIPIDPDNTTYTEIMEKEKEGTLTIKDAD
tara:strand:- start:209 stop:412 length:204 start_codon:yes stop_codon:yes gene_type:complete